MNSDIIIIIIIIIIITISSYNNCFFLYYCKNTNIVTLIQKGTYGSLIYNYVCNQYI